MVCKEKKLLILAGAGVHCKAVEAAQELGVYTIVTDFLPNSPAKKIANESLMYDIFDIDVIVDYSKKNEVSGVLNLCIDPAQKPAQQIAEKLRMPAFGNKEQVYKLTNKREFKRLCIQNNVDVIPEYVEDDIEKGTLNYPVLVKPVDSRGSRGANICNCKEELLSALSVAKTESTDNSAIIEMYMGGHQDLTITYIVKDSNPILISIGDRYEGEKKDNLDRQLSCTIQPSRYTAMYLKNVNSRVIEMIKKLGIKNGPVFMQGFVDGDTVRMYDPGIRFPGNEYERIFTKATGMNPVKSIIKYVLGDGIDDYNGELIGSYNLNGLCAIQYMINVGSGVINAIEGLDIIAKHPNVVDIQQRHFAGDIIEATGDIQHRAGEISILADRDAKQLKDILNFIQSNLKVKDRKGKNMLISPFDPDKLDCYFL